jgi:acetolactate synthase regulatory subunit
MESTHSFELKMWNAPSVLSRVSLILSRRRITPARMLFTVAADPQYCTFEFTVTCDVRAAERLNAQLARVVELIDIDMRSVAPILHTAAEPDASAAA